MSSPAKIKANRANARASTGPKSKPGRARSARNALRHALSIPVERDSALCDAVEGLAREIAGPEATTEIMELARRVAEAQIDLRRVRCARHQLLQELLSKPYRPRRAMRTFAKALLYLLALEDEELDDPAATPAAAIPPEADEPAVPPAADGSPDAGPDDLAASEHASLVQEFLYALQGIPDGPFKLTTILAEKTKKLCALDRYERRALSRRKFAIRALDEARHP